MDGEQSSPGIEVVGGGRKEWDSRSRLGVFALGRSCVPPIPLIPFWLEPYGSAVGVGHCEAVCDNTAPSFFGFPFAVRVESRSNVRGVGQNRAC